MSIGETLSVAFLLVVGALVSIGLLSVMERITKSTRL